MKIRKKFWPKKVTANWSALIKALPQMNEYETKFALDYEVNAEKRKDFILRLHRRYSRLRQKRELDQLFNA